MLQSIEMTYPRIYLLELNGFKRNHHDFLERAIYIHCFYFFVSILNGLTHFSEDLILTTQLKLLLSRKSWFAYCNIYRSMLCPYFTILLSSIWYSWLFSPWIVILTWLLVFLLCHCSFFLSLLFCLLSAIRTLGVALI